MCTVEIGSDKQAQLPSNISAALMARKKRNFPERGTAREGVCPGKRGRGCDPKRDNMGAKSEKGRGKKGAEESCRKKGPSQPNRREHRSLEWGAALMVGGEDPSNKKKSFTFIVHFSIKKLPI